MCQDSRTCQHTCSRWSVGHAVCGCVLVPQYLLISGFGGLCWLVSDGVPCYDNLHYVGAEPLVLRGEMMLLLVAAWCAVVHSRLALRAVL